MRTLNTMQPGRCVFEANFGVPGLRGDPALQVGGVVGGAGGADVRGLCHRDGAP